MQTIYPSKLLLFGEYSIIKGSSVLALPFPSFSGQWIKGKKVPALSPYLYKIGEYLLLQQEKFSSRFLYKQWEQDLTEDLFFESSIPLGYGLGSSAALSAALYDRYFIQATNNTEFYKKELATIENFFHGKSSGIDPLVSYLNKAILIKTPPKIETLELSSKKAPSNQCIFLLDTKKQRSVAPLVNYFLKVSKEDSFIRSYLTPLIANVNTAIEAFLAHSTEDLLNHVKKISSIQLEGFKPMILSNFENIWKKGIQSDDYYLKLCGAGGGGYILGFARNWESTQKLLKEQSIHLVEYL